MNTYSIYNQTTGVFTTKRFTGTPASLMDQLGVDINCSYIIGEYDPLSQKVDLATGLVVDYQPPSPGTAYVWDATTKRWVYTPGPAEALYHAQQDALAKINMLCGFNLADFRKGTPPDEVTSWSKQESEARAWTANNTAATPLLSAIATARNVPLNILASKIIAKADQFAKASGALIGKRQKFEDRINAAATAADVATIMLDPYP